MKYVASLISGVGIFCVGTGLSFYHGVTGLFSTQPMEDFYWVYKFILFQIFSNFQINTGVFYSGWFFSF